MNMRIEGNFKNKLIRLKYNQLATQRKIRVCLIILRINKERIIGSCRYNKIYKIKFRN